ncbi:hypothetical protein CDD81_8100 [Ophiocordyceps australis]|uniref:FHA domain-containing protein n=1 Tax=Ophiocordyceps australis TaxID=1399860 RepID=A0A2C5Y1T8_9HYPO|nr:hypothetical protein CDD81_8100 [Ophiocordyceps australis]
MDSSPLPPLTAEAFGEGRFPPATTPSPVSGSKRPASSLLPAFEPLSSSPALPRPSKRANTAGSNAATCYKYPTPVPTSSTAVLSSSPLAHGYAQSRHYNSSSSHRPTCTRGPGRSAKGAPRAPLSTVPSVELPANGESVSLGRSSSSSQLQLSANRLVSRVHVQARFVAGLTSKIEIVCCGWNGLTLHCQGRTWELWKGDSFSSHSTHADVLIDVLDARVLIRWPSQPNLHGVFDTAVEALSEVSEWDDEEDHGRAAALDSSPLRRATRIVSPESPTPARNGSSSMSSQQSLLGLHQEDNSDSNEQEIHIYEDHTPPDDLQQAQVGNVGVSMRTEVTESFSSPLSDHDDDPDEENDPIIHSFGPFGHNIAGRLASITTSCIPEMSPSAQGQCQGAAAETNAGIDEAESSTDTASRPSSIGSAQDVAETKLSSALPTIDPAIANHVVNQLAFSRLSSTPLSTIMQNLPSDVPLGLTSDSLRDTIEATACIGVIDRPGKDAAGKPLENEYYYMAEKDEDEQRRAAVVDGLRKPSLRNCRKQHKQYYWKRPRTP